MDKNTDSISTVQMKADYASSEIYSTASEAPPVSGSLSAALGLWSGLEIFKMGHFLKTIMHHNKNYCIKMFVIGTIIVKYNWWQD